MQIAKQVWSSNWKRLVILHKLGLKSRCIDEYQNDDDIINNIDFLPTKMKTKWSEIQIKTRNPEQKTVEIYGLPTDT